MKEKQKKVVDEKKQTIISIIELIALITFIVIVLVFFKGTPIWTIVVLLLMLSLLIFVHEGGHFLAAKAFGVHVYEFALGMGPKIIGFKRKNDPTEYTLRALPIGGYCAMAGEEGEDDKSLEKNKFMCNKPKWQRVIILVAGVTMNFILAIVLLFSIALKYGSVDQSSVIGDVTESSPAQIAGIKKGDKIVKFNGHEIKMWDDLTLYNALKKDNTYDIYEIEHPNGKREEYKLTPKKYVLHENEYIEITDELTVDKIKEKYNIKDAQVVSLVGVSQEPKINKGIIASIKYAFVKMWSLCKMMVKILGYLVIGKLGLENLSGPVGMYSIVSTTAAAGGLANLIYLAAYLSINLGVINIIPFPAFDGGRVLFVAIEAITKRKVSPKVEGMFHTVGFILLMILMLYITFNDILKLI